MSSKISALTALAAASVSTTANLIPIVDTGDTTQAASGTTKSITPAALAAAIHAGESITFPTIVAGSAASNIAIVSVQVVDAAGAAVTSGRDLSVWVLNNSTGLGLAATAPDGGITQKAPFGSVHVIVVAGKSLRTFTGGTGLFKLQITDSLKTGYYVAASLGGGPIYVSRQLVTADYG